MITNRAKKSVHQIFLKAAGSRLVVDPGDVCHIELLESNLASEIDKRNIVVLTISSISFKVFFALHVDDDAVTRTYFLKEMNDRQLGEVFTEIANLCCGAINQELIRYFPILGMSTPSILSGFCVSFLRDLKHEHLLSYAITINDSVRIFATICICAYAPIDFDYQEKNVEAVVGELELF